MSARQSVRGDIDRAQLRQFIVVRARDDRRGARERVAAEPPAPA